MCKLHASQNDLKNTANTDVVPATTGILHAAAGYDLLVWVITLGRERAFREKMLHRAHLQPGESVLDVGCGTGTLAIMAKRLIGPKGAVCGIDASPEMIARADHKARKAGVEVVFKNAVVEEMPFPDAHFDAVLSTLMLHHLPRKLRGQYASEINRVLKPGGRVLVIDFGAPMNRKGLFAHLHRHGHVKPTDIIALLSEAGMNIAESGAVGVRDLQYVVATAACRT